MAETIDDELKQQKIKNLSQVLSNIGWYSQKEITNKEIIYFLNSNSKDKQFDNTLSNKLIQYIGIEEDSKITVEEFINIYIQFEDELNQNIIELKKKINDEKNSYNSFQEQCFKYKDEKLNSEGFSENAKLSMEIKDIEIKKKLKNINVIILSLIYNSQKEEFKFDYTTNIIQFEKNIFEFNSTSKRDNFELVLQGIENNDNNENIENTDTIILGKKNFPLEEITSQDEYSVQITIPDLKKKDEIAALVNSKITLHWSDYQFFEEKKKNCENKLLKLKEASSKVNKYLNQIQEIYGTSQNNYNSEKTQATKRHVFPYDSNFNNYETFSGNDLNDFDAKEKEPKDELISKLNNIYGNDKFGVGYEEVRSGYENEVNVNTKNSNRNSYRNLKGVWLIKLLSLLCILFGLFNSLQRADYLSEIIGIICFCYIYYVEKKNLAIKSKRFWHLFLLVFGAMIFDCIFLYFNFNFLGTLPDVGGAYDNVIRRLSYFTTGCTGIIKCCLSILMFAQYKLNY